MNTKENEKVENVVAEESESLEMYLFEDLSPEDEQIKGGNPVCSGCGGVGNHNETVEEDEEAKTAPLADLEPDGEIKGGPGSGAGGVWLNHNETIAIDDLETPNASNIKGGETLTLGCEQDGESIKKPSTISMKLRKPAK